MKKEAVIPPQKEGSRLDTSQSVTAFSVEDAKRIFEEACERLANVNQWAELCGPLSATFQLTDKQGEPLDRPAREGDYLKIKIPGPGISAGAGFDWAFVESRDNFYDELRDSHVSSMRVRPASSPVAGTADTAHFFKDEATSNFMVERTGLIIIASVHGRNELPNTRMEKGADSLRNSIIARGAISGFSKLQWNALVSGVLEGLV